jgi:mono/diheme cytochrome c family protein
MPSTLRFVGLTLVAMTVLPAVGMSAAPPAPATLSAKIEVWQRKSPAAASGVEGRKDVRSFDLDALPSVETRRPDIQYAGSFSYRGVALRTLIERYAPPPEVDLALLHFANGMQVPFAFRDARLAKALDLFIAREMRPAPGAPFQKGRFPSISRAREGFVDVRPILFGANKLVVSQVAHPLVPVEAQAVFSPWMHLDSLTGIELVSSRAYYAQFDVDSDPGVRAGYRLFTQSCQFCHGARGVGAAFGWDFVQPVAIYSYHDELNLFYHVKYKPLDATARGLQMPALSYMTEQDAASIWRWLRAIATHPMPSYAP